jgi:uncharacterized protein (DUF2141 family)
MRRFDFGRVYLLFFILLLSGVQAFSQFKLHIRVTGIKTDTGVIMLQLLNEQQEVEAQEKGTIRCGISEMTFIGIIPGKYAIRYFQDENGNGELDKNKLGIPTEGYGFSNNAYGMFGPKPFKDWLFEVNDDKELVLKIKN